ncbi:MAG: carboxypeptidase-like regulatory domain-containing protein, partial [Pyrinomonadaceae bacterium]
MRKVTRILAVGLMLLLAQAAIQAQLTTGSISGTVTDVSGAVVPGASVNVKGQGGQNYTAVTNGEGYFTIPGVQAGTPTYTVSISAPNFKTAVVQNVKVDVGTPATVNAVLQAGQISEQVVITGGGEVLQSETATIGTTISGRQILETPIQSRDALDLVALLPGTATVGTIRTSSINGLPKSAITIQIDGVDVQDNYLKSSDGFFTFIRPRIDAIDEVTVSTSNPGAQASGDGAVSIGFATRRGTDSYRGSGFWQHRDEGLNATNFQNNYQRINKAKLRLNQFGFSVGGPIPFLNFGEGVDAFDSGKGKRFFFVNYERFHLNEGSTARSRVTLTPQAQGGTFRYGAGGASQVSLFQLAQNAGLANTIDPTVNSMLNTIQAATNGTGSYQALGLLGNFNTRSFVFSNVANQRRRFLTIRGDANITKDHAVELIINDQPFRSTGDFLNNQDSIFPGIENYGAQFSDRRSLSLGFRSNFGTNVINQFRYAQLAGWLGGGTVFGAVTPESFFDDTQRGFNIALGSNLAGLTAINNNSARTSPTRDFTDVVTWVKGNHTFQFGGQLKSIKTDGSTKGFIRPTISFGYLGDELDSRVRDAFNETTMPGASPDEIFQARELYATLTGRVAGYAGNATLGPDGRYVANGTNAFIIEEETNGLFAQDTWRFKNNFQITAGVRWQPTLGAKLNTASYSFLTNPATMAYDVSGYGNSFSPGTLTGQVPTFTGNTAGQRAYENDLNNFAPSVGVVWSPNFSGFLGKVLGREGAGVIRGGFARAFVREGTFLVDGSIGLHPGGSFGLARTPTSIDPNTLLTAGTLFRNPGNPNLVSPTFNPIPSYPRPVDPELDLTVAFKPDLKTGYVDSWSLGYQRQFGSDTVVEVSYVANRGKDMHLFYNVNEINAVENGFGAEFRLAQQNLYANIAAGRGANFRYFGPDSGTSPLPIILSYFASTNP